MAERVERLSEEELLARSTDDLVAELAPAAMVDPPLVHDEPIDGDVSETMVDVSHDFGWNGNKARGLRVTATYQLDGDAQVLRFEPSTRLLIHHHAVVGDGTITVETTHPGMNLTADQAKGSLAPEIDRIRKMTEYAAADIRVHNSNVEDHLRRVIDGRRDRILKRRELAGALGFPLTRRPDAPRPVPLQRKPMGVTRSQRAAERTVYRDEPALTTEQYEDAIAVVRSTLLAMERTPSVASGKSEEELRDQILVQLNGTFAGAATGETFVQKGKTDILVRVDDRHVFVGECKWWSGSKGLSDAVDQLLSYLPWRDEKAALVVFIDRKDASAAIEKADEAIRSHSSFKRAGPESGDSAARRNYVLGHPGDPEREIHVAVLFAVLPKD